MIRKAIADKLGVFRGRILPGIDFVRFVMKKGGFKK